MKSLKKLIGAASALAAGTLSAAIALAEEAAHGGGHEEITFLGDWLPRLVNFAILAAVLVYFLRKPVRDFFKGRTAAIEKSMQESKEARERAVAALSEMERKIKELEAETDRMIAEAKARGEKDKQALLDEGKKVAQDIQAQVKTGIDIELQKAKTALSVEASLLAVDLAEDTLKDKISKQDHERIVKEYISKVGGKG
jgi:F-type H+-transporting ATPase subunit b